MRKRKNIRKFTISMKRKMALLFIIFTVMMLGLIGRILYIGKYQGDDYKRKVFAQQRYDSRVIPYKRGDILDRKGTAFATSVKVYNLIIDPKIILDKEIITTTTVDALSEFFGFDKAEIQKIINEKSNSRYVPIKKQLSYDEVHPFEEYKQNNENGKHIKGIWFEEDFVRMYPFNNMASHIIGYTSKGNVGNWGIEEAYNNMLNGENGREYGILNEDSILERTIKPAKNGYNIITTIDQNIQSFVEEEIQKFNEEYGSKYTSVIVMNPNNAEILAMASYPSFDLNNPMDLSSMYSEQELEAMSSDDKLTILNGIWRNFNISDTYEPGSTVKPITIGAAIEEGYINPEDTYECDGYEIVAGRRISCSKREGHGIITLGQAIAYSCNDVMMQVAAKMGSSNLVKYQRLFGFGQKTNIDLLGEASAETLVYSADRMGPVELATNSFGQSYNVTPIQLMTSFSAVINGGYLYEPYIVKQIVDETGANIKTINKKLVKQTLSKKTSDLLREYLQETVEDGTGKKAKIEGFTIGGKTGTAEKLPRGNGKYVVSFIGFAPVEKPEVAILVVIDEPERVEASSSLASNMFKEILAKILPYTNIYPTN